MLKVTKLEIEGFSEVLELVDDAVSLHAFIALHNTDLGPALGGVRMYPYSTREEALKDVLRLARGMTYKAAVAEVGLGGGKSVIIGDPSTLKSQKLLESFAQGVNLLKGQYITAEDVGTTTDDMMTLFRITPYVSALPLPTSSGDPSRFTAWGVFRGMQAVAHTLFDSPSLLGKRVAIQGLGNVGKKLATTLFWAGAELILTDTHQKNMETLAREFRANWVRPNEIYDIEADIFAPCALGGILNRETIERLKVKAVCGSANNQLLTEEDGKRLFKKNILYAPDFVVNAGGLINAAAEFEPGGYDPRVARDKTSRIYDLLTEVFEEAEKRGVPTSVVANDLAEYKLEHRVAKRREKIAFPPPREH